MFIGHFAVGFGAKKFAPKVSLGTLFFAGQFVDFVWAALTLLGIEHTRIVPGFTKMVPLELYHVPYSHSLIGALALSVIFGAVYFAFRRDRRTALLLGGVVFSHWLLDLFTHAPDLPIAPGLPYVLGMGLWNYPPASITVEAGLFIIGVAMYVGATSSKGWTGHLAFWPIPSLLGFLWLGNMTNTPPNTTVVAFSTLSLLILIPWAAWADRRRVPASVSPQPAVEPTPVV